MVWHWLASAAVTAIYAAITAKAIYEILHYSRLTWRLVSEAVSKLRSGSDIKATYQAKLKSGEPAIVAGIFDADTGEALYLEALTYDEISNRVAREHSGDQIVIWN